MAQVTLLFKKGFNIEALLKEQTFAQINLHLNPCSATDAIGPEMLTFQCVHRFHTKLIWIKNNIYLRSLK